MVPGGHATPALRTQAGHPVLASGPRTLGFATLLLLSGFCGISYEVLYGRALSSFIGEQFAVNAAVLLTFLLGIGWGSFWSHRFWRFLWMIEAGVGLCGAAFALGVDALDTWVYAPSFVRGGAAGSILVCFLLLALPGFLIGCSFPLFAGYLARLGRGRGFATAYTVYNFGAGVTALLIEFWLLRLLGVRGTLLTMASLNALVSLCLYLGFGPLRQDPEPPPERPWGPAGHLFALAIAGVASAVFQLLMIKLGECFLGPFRETFALVLALVLFGIAAGSKATERWHLDFGTVLVAGLVGLAWLLAGFELVTRAYAAARPLAVESRVATVLLKLLALALLMGVPALSFGATLPALLGREEGVAHHSGRLLFVSSTANAGGFLLMAFVLHRYLDYGVLIVAVAALATLALLLYARLGVRLSAAALGLLLLVVALHRTAWQEDLLYLGHTAFHSTSELAEARAEMAFPERFKGYQDVFSLNRTRSGVHFFINGFISMSLTSPAERIVGAFSSLFAPRTDRALVLGLGSGATTGAVAVLFDRTDAVEINPVVVENLYRMAPYNFDVQSRPGVRIFLDDGIHHVKVSRERYSLIINTVTTPLYFTSSKLYTHDFLEAVSRRLTPDGVYVTWIDSRVGERGVDIILRTLSKSFKECWIGAIKASYFLLICSRQSLAIRQPNLIAGHPLLTEYLLNENGLRPDWLPYGLLTTHGLDLVSDAQAPINTLDYPALEFEIARLPERSINEFKGRLRGRMAVGEIAAALRPVMAFDPIELALHSELLLGDSTITDRWRELVAREVPDFDGRYGRAKLDHHAFYAARANTAHAHHQYGSALLAEGRYGDAIREFQTTLAIDAASNNTYFNLGASYEKLGDLEAALESYARELTVDPGDQDVSFRQGRVAYKLKRYPEASAFLAAAAARQQRAEIAYYQGLVFEALGAPEDAKKAYVTAVQLDSSHEEARRALSRLGGESRAEP